MQFPSFWEYPNREETTENEKCCFLNQINTSILKSLLFWAKDKDFFKDFLLQKEKKEDLFGDIFCPAPTTTGHKPLVYMERSDMKPSQNPHRVWKGNTSLPWTALSTAVNWKWDFIIAKERKKNCKKNKVMKGLLTSALFSVLTARRIEQHQILKLNIQNEIKEKIWEKIQLRSHSSIWGSQRTKVGEPYFTTQQEQREVLKSGACYIKPNQF